MNDMIEVDLRMPADLLADLRSRVKGTKISLDHYVGALLMVQVIGMINAGREEERRWNQHQRAQVTRPPRPPFAWAGIPAHPRTT